MRIWMLALLALAFCGVAGTHAFADDPVPPDEVTPRDPNPSDVDDYSGYTLYQPGAHKRCCRHPWEDPPPTSVNTCGGGNCQVAGTVLSCGSNTANGRVRAGRCESDPNNDHDCHYTSTPTPTERHTWSCGPVTCKRPDNSSGVRCGWVKGAVVASVPMNDCQGPACP